MASKSTGLEIARQRIAEEARTRSGKLNLSDLWLDELPTEISGLTWVRVLSMTRTGVTDLGPLSGLSGLQTLCCMATRVTDLAPVAALSALQSLNCRNTGVT